MRNMLPAVRSLLAFGVSAMGPVGAGLIGAGCPINPPLSEGEGESGEGEGEDGPTYPPADTDLVAAVGSSATFDIASLNLKNFPCGNSANSTVCRNTIETTPSLVADLIASLDVDLIAVQEVASIAAFDELDGRLPYHEGLLSPHTYSDGSYQKVGYLYDSRVLSTSGAAPLFSGFAFPRPALEATFDYDDGVHRFSFLAIAVHLKAGETNEDEERRAEAIVSLEGYVRNKVETSGMAVVMLGDFNEVVDESDGRAVFAPLLDTSTYTIQTQPLANAGQQSFIGSGSIIDHMVTTTTTFGDVGQVLATVIPRVDLEVTNYRDLVSDHLPVVMKLNLTP